MAQENGLEQRVKELERRVAELSAKVMPDRQGMAGAELVAFMRAHGEALAPIFEEALKLRLQDREKAYRKYDREQARKAAKKLPTSTRQRAGT
jgi:hypothetical protein